MTETFLRKAHVDDLIMIISKGQIKEYGTYGSML